MSKQQHLGRISAKAKKFFADSRDQTKGAIVMFINGVAQGLKDVDKNWINRTSLEQQKRFDKVFDVAKEEMVCKSDGGKCEDDGLSVSTFNSYKSLAKKVHIYRTRWQTAKNCSMKTLQIAQKIKRGEEADFNTTQNLAHQKFCQKIDGKTLSEEDKMDVAVDALEEAAKELGTAKVSASANRTMRSGETTPWTLPDFDGYNDLDESVKIVVDYWEQTKLVQQVNGDTPVGQSIRRALGELNAYLKLKAANAA